MEKEIDNAKKMAVSEAVKTAMLAELEETKKSLGAVTDLAAVEADVYSHLTNFFSRYYDEGDFISQRRYKDGVYAIPYEGEEVKLHWANADQYYIKTSEYFKNYSFKTAYGKKAHFKLVEADTERDNNKAKKKRLFQLYADNPFALEDGELIICFEYKEGDKKQEAYIAEVVSEFAKVAAKYIDYTELTKAVDGKTLLERQLKSYTARNNFDYFIHKDLGGFLNRELDFYIKTEVMFLDDIDEQSDTRMKEYITKAKVIRNISKKIITFLTQIENFQKKLWLKKKFVVETNYCITLDRVTHELYNEILVNSEQINEWKKLYNIEAIKKDLVNEGYSELLTMGFLEQNPYLMIDTAYFSDSFKERLIDSIENLDDALDGLLIHSENYQALNLLQERYREQIKCIYIDPPYNTDASVIAYKNNYRHSSWLSLLNDRLCLGRTFLEHDGIQTVTIDEYELKELYFLIESLYGRENVAGIIAIRSNPSGRPTTDGLALAHEYAIITKNSTNSKILKIGRSEDQASRYDKKDKDGIYEQRNFRREGSNSDRENGKRQWYPIYVNKDTLVIRVPEMEWIESTELWNILEKPNKYEVTIYPITDNGIEKNWRWSWGNVKKDYSQFYAKKQNENIQVYYKYRPNEDGITPLTFWGDSKYSATEHGTKPLKDLLPGNSFAYPKSIYAVNDTLSIMGLKNGVGTVLDFFAGSGTTGHAVINLNREDGGDRKYILIEMGEYFDTVTKPRIMKVIYSKDWKDGNPVSREGSSHAFKYLRLESYEDTLNNINIQSSGLDMISNPAVQEQYLLQNMLPKETEGSPSLLNIDMLEHPFNYSLEIIRNLESQNKLIDLVETFNYLIGLKVEKSYQKQGYDAEFTVSEYGRLDATIKTGDTYNIKMIEGTSLNGDKVLVIWRDLTGDKEKDNAVLDAYFLRKKINTRDFEFKKIYVNGDNNLPNLKDEAESWKVLLIEEEMKIRMFEVE